MNKSLKEQVVEHKIKFVHQWLEVLDRNTDTDIETRQLVSMQRDILAEYLHNLENKRMMYENRN